MIRWLALPFAILWVAGGLTIFGLLAVVDWITGSRWRWPTRVAKKI